MQFEEYLQSRGSKYEDDHTDIDLREALSQISETERMIIVMRLEGFKVNEIGERLNISHQAVSYHLRKIRRKAIA